MEAVRTSETSVDNHFTRQYNPEDSSEQASFMYTANNKVAAAYSSRRTTTSWQCKLSRVQFPINLVKGKYVKFTPCFIKHNAMRCVAA
jgi:hypothetical protein